MEMTEANTHTHMLCYDAVIWQRNSLIIGALLWSWPTCFCVCCDAHNCSFSYVVLRSWSVCPLRLTLIFTPHTNKCSHGYWGSQKHSNPFQPPHPPGIRESCLVRSFVSSRPAKKTSLKDGRRGRKRRGDGGKRTGCFICLKWDWGRMGHQSPLP